MAAVSDKVLRMRATACAGFLGGRHPDAGPAPAVTLAKACGIKGSHETARRRIREAIEFARQKMGIRFCANGDGYWIARDAGEWGRFRESQKARTVFRFVRAAECQRAVTERMNRQGRLFDLGPVGVADV
jgi:hypothetical protein